MQKESFSMKFDAKFLINKSSRGKTNLTKGSFSTVLLYCMFRRPIWNWISI